MCPQTLQNQSNNDGTSEDDHLLAVASFAEDSSIIIAVLALGFFDNPSLGMYCSEIAP